MNLSSESNCSSQGIPRCGESPETTHAWRTFVPCGPIKARLSTFLSAKQYLVNINLKSWFICLFAVEHEPVPTRVLNSKACVVQGRSPQQKIKLGKKNCAEIPPLVTSTKEVTWTPLPGSY